MSLPSMLPRRDAIKRAAFRGVALAAIAVALVACQHTQPDVTDTIPTDYRLRHPIAIKEGNRTVELFIGSARGALTPAQRANLASFAYDWSREATGGIVIELPSGTPNGRAAHDALGEIRSLLTAAGVPPNVIAVQSYRPFDQRKFATVRINYPKMTATAGPCGLWPRDLGPTYDNPDYLNNRPYYNLGCASQRNLAAMVEDPSDLAQPRGETPLYTPRRSFILDKYRKGESTATVHPNANDGKISDVGK
jgi:pilus assembly protein CpaD